jgi:homoaconitate hydratase
MPALTLIEKLATGHAVGLAPGQCARQGDFITIRPRHIMTHDNTSAVMGKFRELFKGLTDKGGTPVPPAIHDARQPIFAIDHDIQNKTPENLGKYARIESFAREQPGGGIDFYPAGTGISHQVMVEQGYVTPGSMVVGSDSHSNLYGALCCLGTPVVRTDAASIWATGVTWWQVPPVAKCVLKGRLQPGVVGKDVIVALCGLFNHDEVLNHAVEFVPEEAQADSFRGLSIDQRMTIANMTTEWGALVGIFPFDEVLRDYLYSRAEYFARGRRPGVRRPDSLGSYTRADVDRWWSQRHELRADPGARYGVELELDLSTVVPHISGPNSVKTMVAVPEIEKQRVKINKAWLMSCVNARYEDIAEASRILKGRKVAAGVEFYLAAASAEVQERALRDGHWQAILDAGAIELPPGCGTCIGLGRGTIRAGEVGISATNRNFEGRMGDREGLVYLGSPAVVAASAVAGYIAMPPGSRFSGKPACIAIRRANGEAAAGAPAGGGSGSAAAILEGFREQVRGRVIWLPRDNLNTDGIYSGKLTYRDEVPRDEMAAASFNNYDPEFVKLARSGDIVVSGRNFGTGSSREQAATCLKHFGIPCVIAYSFSETYKRNAFNNGFVVFECPGMVEYLERSHPRPSPGGEGEKTVVGPDIEIDYRRSVIRCDAKEFPFAPLSTVAQELVVAGGAENVVRKRLGTMTPAPE